jgi:single-stranded-DNA-specific exonuclease
VDVVVIDHHTVPVELPAAVAVINPHRADCTRGSEMLCAVGVTFNLVAAVKRALVARAWFDAAPGGLRPAPDLKTALDLVALGTVADVVPLVGENRILVHNGLKLLRQGRRLGMRALLDIAQVELADVDAGTLGFQLGPRVNAAGRLGDAMKAVALLRTADDDEAHRQAIRLDRENAARKDLERRIVAEAIAQVEQSALLREAPVIVVHDEGWHPGVVGIVASRLVDRFGRPSIVIGEGGRGSGRSIERFHLHEGLTAVKHTLAGYGGHAHAAGVRVAAGGVERFREELVQHARSVLSADDLHRVIVHDGPLAVSDVSLALVRALERAAPFGRKNPEPTFLFQSAALKNVRELPGGHVKGVVDPARGLEVIAFGAADRAGALARGVDFLATPELNTWRGASTLQLRVKDIAPS